MAGNIGSFRPHGSYARTAPFRPANLHQGTLLPCRATLRNGVSGSASHWCLEASLAEIDSGFPDSGSRILLRASHSSDSPTLHDAALRAAPSVRLACRQPVSGTTSQASWNESITERLRRGQIPVRRDRSISCPGSRLPPCPPPGPADALRPAPACQRRAGLRLLPARVPRAERRLPPLRQPLARRGRGGPGAGAARRQAEVHLDPVGPRAWHGRHAGPGDRRRAPAPARMGHDVPGPEVGLAGGPLPRQAGGDARA